MHGAARREAIYFYEHNGRGAAFAFDGDKKFVGSYRGATCTHPHSHTQTHMRVHVHVHV